MPTCADVSMSVRGGRLVVIRRGDESTVRAIITMANFSPVTLHVPRSSLCGATNLGLVRDKINDAFKKATSDTIVPASMKVLYRGQDGMNVELKEKTTLDLKSTPFRWTECLHVSGHRAYEDTLRRDERRGKDDHA